MSRESNLTFIIIVYLVSGVIFLSALVVCALTVRTRRRVQAKHERDMKILATWEGALEGLYSSNEAEVIISLDKIWALTGPYTYAEIQPILTVLSKHSSPNISMKAQKIFERYTDSEQHIRAEPPTN